MKTIKTITIITLVLFFSACKKQAGPQGPSGEAGANGTVTNGTITGRVVRYDEYGTLSNATWSNTSVSIDGTSFSTITDTTGSYTLNNVPAGVYTISYSKLNLANTKEQQISFPGNGKLYVNTSIADKATFNITGYVKDTIVSSVPQIRCNIAITTYTNSRNITVIYSKVNSLTISNNLSYQYVEHFNTYPNSTNFQFGNTYIYNNPAYNSIFPSGSVIYVKVYPNNTQKSSYYDYPSGKYVYTGCGIPIATTFTLTKP